MDIKVEVSAPYPCTVTIHVGRHDLIQLSHSDLLALEHAVAEAKRQVLCNLPRRYWHEVDSRLAQPLEG